MQVAPEISFRNMEPSDVIEADVRDHIAKLEQVYDRITSCKVVIQAPNQEAPTGEPYHVRIYAAVPQHDIVVDQDPGDKQSHQKDVSLAIRDAFQAARRQLTEVRDKLRNRTKTHEIPPHGLVKTVYPEKEYGFIETPDGREVYFHANSVRGIDFTDLEYGSQVRFEEELAEKGPQATVVHPVGRHHHFVD